MHLRTAAAALLTGLSAALTAGLAAVAAESQTAPARYHACMDLVAQDAERALTQARAWQSKGGGAPAAHCAAAALLQQARFSDAAQDLEAIAAKTEGNRALRASLYGQAAHAWLSADEPEKAQQAASAALTSVPGTTELLVLRARALGAQRKLSEAVRDLDQALVASPDDVDALVFRASARRQQRLLTEASTDLDRALAIAPTHPEALLERGIVYRLQGNEAGARQAWTRLIEAAPRTPAAEQARVNLERVPQPGEGG